MGACLRRLCEIPTLSKDIMIPRLGISWEKENCNVKWGLTYKKHENDVRQARAKMWMFGLIQRWAHLAEKRSCYLSMDLRSAAMR